MLSAAHAKWNDKQTVLVRLAGARARFPLRELLTALPWASKPSGGAPNTHCNYSFSLTAPAQHNCEACWGFVTDGKDVKGKKKKEIKRALSWAAGLSSEVITYHRDSAFLAGCVSWRAGEDARGPLCFCLPNNSFRATRQIELASTTTAFVQNILWQIRMTWTPLDKSHWGGALDGLGLSNIHAWRAVA